MMSCQRGPNISRTRARLLFVIGSLDVGGTENHLVSFLPRLAETFDVSVCCLSHRGKRTAELEARGVTVYSPPLEKVFGRRSTAIKAILLALGSLRLLQLCLRGPDAIHFFLPGSYLIGAPLALATRVPITIMSRRSLNKYQQRRPWLRKAELWLHQRMTALCGNSKAVIRELIEDEHCPKERVHLIYGGVDTDRFRPAVNGTETRAGLNFPADAMLIVSVANIIPYKGHSDLLQALASVKDQLPAAWRLLCVGRDDGSLPMLKDLARQLHIAEMVEFLGGRDDIADILAAADIAVLASHEEGFSNFILEAMASGLPVVATDVGGNAEAVLDSVTGCVVKPREPVELGRAILSIANDKGLAERFGREGRGRALQVFSLERCLANYQTLYARLLTAESSEAACAPKNLDSAS